MSFLENSYTIYICDEELVLLPQKAIYFTKHKTLLASDLHLGKTAHFRKAGIAVPADLAMADLYKLEEIFSSLDIERFIVLGDLFHAEINLDWTIFREWRNNYSSLQIELIKGNHDILHISFYEDLKIISHKNFVFNNFYFTHNPKDKVTSDCEYILSGHVHPAVRLEGKGRQRITLPCFYFGKTLGILPAFGKFTGKYIIRPNEKDNVYVITETVEGKKVLKM